MRNYIGLAIAMAIIVIVVVIVITMNNSSKSNKVTVSNKDNKEKSISKDNKSSKQTEKDANLTVVPTLLDSISEDSCWCATFQLVWNDMKNEVVKQDVVFTPQEVMADNLNKETFTQDMISPSYYYKKYGKKTLALKEEIEKGIKEKFNQESEILDDFDWTDEGLDKKNDNVDRYFFYSMLYRKFQYSYAFDKLKNGTFGQNDNNIKYFGIDDKTDEIVDEQLKVLYYKTQDDFAIIVNTKDGDEVIFHKKPSGNTFKEIYENMNKQAESYVGKKYFTGIDKFKAPYLEFKQKKEYKEVENKVFPINDSRGSTGRIEKALQFISFSIDETGGDVKSEAGIDMIVDSAILEEPAEKPTPRYFNVDDTFVLFIREKGMSLPYFAAKINDIKKYQ